MTGLSRRAFTRFAVRLAAFWTAGASARGAEDRGLGGTGAVPTDPDETVGQDRGIGGTGVVGTIRRFGSIVVNDLRVAYPPDVRVTIDGVRATAVDLRIGQVVRVLARRRRSGLATRAVSVTNEVVGPVDTLDETEQGREAEMRGATHASPLRLTVLGQTILADRDLRGRLRHGEVVAVAGLRRPDGTIVASLIVPKASGTPSRLAGPVLAGPDGVPRIGGLAIVGVKPSLIGRRVVLAGRRIGNSFRASAVTVEPSVPFAGADRLSIEGYLARSGDAIRFGSGITLAAGQAGTDLDDDAVVKAVVTATPDGQGNLAVTGIHVERGSGNGAGGPGQPSPGDHARPGMPGPRGAPPPGAAPSGAPPNGGASGGGGLGGGGLGGGGLGGGGLGGGGFGGGGPPGGAPR